jgi:hypothetical protein
MLDIVGNTRLLRAGVYLATRLVSVGEQPLDRAMVEAVLTDRTAAPTGDALCPGGSS